MPIISVIIPAYNAAGTLARAIRSVQRQSLPDWQLVVVDDASTDASRQVAVAAAERDSRIVFAAHASREGLYMARMTGIGRAEGRWITFLDADDWLSRDALLRLTQAADATPAPDIIAMNFRYRLTALHLPYAPASMRVEAETAPVELRHRLLRSIIDSEPAMSPAAWGKAYRASLLQATVFPDYQAFWGEDRIFLLVLLRQRPALRAIDYIGYNYRWGGASKQFDLSTIEQYRQFIDAARPLLPDEAEDEALTRLKDSLLRYFVSEAIAAGTPEADIARAIEPYHPCGQALIAEQAAAVAHRRLHYLLRRFA